MVFKCNHNKKSQLSSSPQVFHLSISISLNICFSHLSLNSIIQLCFLFQISKSSKHTTSQGLLLAYNLARLEEKLVFLDNQTLQV